MRGKLERQASMLTLIGPEQRVPKDHPIRRIKLLADRELQRLSPVFEAMYSGTGRTCVGERRAALRHHARRTARVASLVEVASAGRLAWLAYPKARQLGTDLDRDFLRGHLRQHGIDPVRRVALDDV